MLAILLAPWLAPAPAGSPAAEVTSHVAIFDVETGKERLLLSRRGRYEAPNWLPDGRDLLLNSGGRLFRVPLAGGEPEPVDTGTIRNLNNDHGISPDGKRLAISAGPIYVLPAEGGEPRKVTEKEPSYFHGWSPDGSTLAYCARRDGNFDLYAVVADGGEERRLTAHAGYDDGPDYTPDGKWIYFNSDRSGSWDVWRIPADGAGPDDAKAERITRDDLEDWFPHPSPDGKWLVFISFPKGTEGHPADRDVVLRLLPLPGADASKVGTPRELIRFNGGQGTINVNSWSPDGKRFAFVRYTASE